MPVRSGERERICCTEYKFTEAFVSSSLGAETAAMLGINISIPGCFLTVLYDNGPGSKQLIRYVKKEHFRICIFVLFYYGFFLCGDVMNVLLCNENENFFQRE